MNRIGVVALFSIAAVIILLGVIHFLPVGMDWHIFRNVGRAMVNSQDIYAEQSYFNAPWLAALLIPFALQDDATGNALIFILGFVSFAYVAYRFGARKMALVIFLLSPGVLANQVFPNVDWLVLLGVLLKPQYGLFLLVIKPQVGIGVALIWLIQAWQAGRIRGVVKTFTPISLALALSIAVYGLWFLRGSNLTSSVWNASLFPYSLPFGIVLLWFALRRLRPDWAISATVLCSPYVFSPSWSGAFLSFARSAPAMLIATIAWWSIRMVASLR